MKPGDKVICIEDGFGGLVLNKCYTIKETKKNYFPTMQIEEIPGVSFHMSRFCAVEEVMKVGDIVVCVDAERSGGKLKSYDIYTVYAVEWREFGNKSLVYVDQMPDMPYFVERFRIVRKTDPQEITNETSIQIVG